MNHLKEIERILATPDGQDELHDGDVCKILSTLLHRRALATAYASGHPEDLSKGDAQRLFAVSDRLNSLATLLSM